MTDFVYEYSAEITMPDEEITAMAIVIDACRSKGSRGLPFAISDDELRSASLGLQRLATALGYGT